MHPDLTSTASCSRTCRPGRARGRGDAGSDGRDGQVTRAGRGGSGPSRRRRRGRRVGAGTDGVAAEPGVATTLTGSGFAPTARRGGPRRRRAGGRRARHGVRRAVVRGGPSARPPCAARRRGGGAGRGRRDGDPRRGRGVTAVDELEPPRSRRPAGRDGRVGLLPVPAAGPCRVRAHLTTIDERHTVTCSAWAIRVNPRLSRNIPRPVFDAPTYAVMRPSLPVTPIRSVLAKPRPRDCRCRAETREEPRAAACDSLTSRVVTPHAMDHLHSVHPEPHAQRPQLTITYSPLRDAVAILSASGSDWVMHLDADSPVEDHIWALLEAAEILARRGDAAGIVARDRRHVRLVPSTTTTTR